MQQLVAFYIFLFLLAVAAAQAVFYYPAMPARMAAHFDFWGNPDGWTTKNGFFIFEGILLLTAGFAGMPYLFEKFEIRKSINLPNREFWLAPERIGDFYVYFRTAFLWFGVATLILFVFVFQMVFQANLAADPSIENGKFLFVLSAYLIFVIIWTISFCRKFNKIPQIGSGVL